MTIRAPCRPFFQFRGCFISGSTISSATSTVDSLPRQLLSTFSGPGTQSQRWPTRTSSSSSLTPWPKSNSKHTHYISQHTRANTYTAPASSSTSRTMATAASTTSSSKDLSQLSRMKYGEGEDTLQLESDVRSLVEDYKWVVDEEGMGVKKTFYFKGYFKAVSFLNFIAAESAAKKHHAIMTLRIGSVDVYWTTHQPRGFTHKDVVMARHCDKGAELMGSVEPDQGLKCAPAERPK